MGKDDMLDKNNFIPLASPNIHSEDIAALMDVLASGNLVQGERVNQLEASLEKYLNIKHCIAVSNGTASLHLILAALGIGPGDEVIIPAFSYIATANVIELVGATPIFVDISLTTFNIETSEIEAKISSKTKAVMVVHEFGLCADLHEINGLCQKYKLALIEDAACALGAKERDVNAGTIGIAGSFSFHPRKAITSGEGGAIVTNDSELASKLRALRNHGINYDIETGPEFTYAGFNYRMTDMQAALLVGQLARIDDILLRKNLIAKAYRIDVKNKNITLPTVPKTKFHAWQTFHILLDEKLSQKTMIDYFRQAKVGVNYGAQCIPAQKFYQKKYAFDAVNKYPNAMRAFTHGLAIPLYEKLNPEDISHITSIMNRI